MAGYRLDGQEFVPGKTSGSFLFSPTASSGPGSHIFLSNADRRFFSKGCKVNVVTKY
jgi:hypothetical protein